MKTYNTVQEWLDTNIAPEYHGWYAYYGDPERTDVKKWLQDWNLDSDQIADGATNES